MERKKILVVDDKTEFRHLLKLYLSKKYDVETAGSGVQALALLNSGYVPDLIISDLVMPGLDGKSLVKKLTFHQDRKGIPILILSSLDKSTDRIELFKLGADDYLVKPFNPEELEVRIEKLMMNLNTTAN